MRYIQKVLLLQDHAGASSRLNNRKIFTNTIRFLGKIILQSHQKLVCYTTDAVQGFKPAINHKKLYPFLALSSALRQPVHTFARIVPPRNRHLIMNHPLTIAALDGDKPYTMETLRTLLTSHITWNCPVLKY